MSEVSEAWRRAIATGGEPQLDFTEKILRSPWVACVQELLDGVSPSTTAAEWAEVLVLAIVWEQGPGTVPSEIVIGLPAQVNIAFPGESYLTVALFPVQEEEEEADEPVQIAIQRVPASRLECLRESVPQAAEMVHFSEVLPGWLPDVALTFGEIEQSGFQGSVALFLGGGDRAAQCFLCLTAGGPPIEEIYASAGEGTDLDPIASCRALVRVTGNAGAGRST
eukprot:6470171-Amphidinium_carterae.1